MTRRGHPIRDVSVVTQIVPKIFANSNDHNVCGNYTKSLANDQEGSCCCENPLYLRRVGTAIANPIINSINSEPLNTVVIVRPK